MPAVLSAIFSAIYSAFANKSLYRDTLYSVFPAMEPRLTNGTMAMESHHEPMPFGVRKLDLTENCGWNNNLLLPRVMDDLQKHRQDINSLESHPLWQSLLLEGSLLVSSCGLQVFGGWRRKSCTTTKMRGRCRLKSALLMQPHECIYQIRCGCANKCRHVLVSQLIE